MATKEELKAKYSRMREDPSQPQMFAYEMIDIVKDNEAEIAHIENDVLPVKADLGGGKVPASQLPSYVDDVVEYPTRSDFPAEGELGKIYVADDTGYTYRWSGSQYIQVGGSATYSIFPSSWNTSGTTLQFCNDVNAYNFAVAGMAYYGELRCSDLPFNGNADAVVEIIDDTISKVIHIIITSGNVAPYRWEYTYWNNGSNVSGWIGYETEIRSFELSSNEYQQLVAGNNVVLASSDERYKLLQDNALRIKVAGTSIAMICNKHINVNNVIAFSYADYSVATDDVKIAYLVFTPGTNQYTISRILKEVKVLAKDMIEATNSGTIVDELGLDSQGNLVKQAKSLPSFFYDASTTYAENQAVWYNGYLFISAVNNNVGHTPDATQDTAYWLRLVVSTAPNNSLATSNGDYITDSQGDYITTEEE